LTLSLQVSVSLTRGVMTMAWRLAVSGLEAPWSTDWGTPAPLDDCPKSLLRKCAE
jgi:hypothetical protein